MHKLITLWLVLSALLILAAPTMAEETNHSAANSRGIYVYSLNIAVDKAPADAPQVIQALETPGADGITLVENWSSIESARGVFEWDLVPVGQGRFDQWLSTAVLAGKKINLAIRAGEYTPCWLFQATLQPCGAEYTGSYAGAKQFSFQSSPHQGESRPTCETVNIAAPWDTLFLREWDSMLGAVSRHLKDVGAYDAVKLVRLTGINRTTDEFRLPEEVLSSPCTDSKGNAHTDTNSISTWLKAGYRPSLLLQAWDRVTDSFRKSFPDKTFNLPIIPIDTGTGQYPFPEIDESGCVYTSIVPKATEWSEPPAIPSATCVNQADLQTADTHLGNVLTDLLGLASRRFPRHLVVEFENLETSKPASQTVVQAAETLGTLTGFMTNNYFASHGGAGAACSGGFLVPVPCPDSASYLALLQIGIYPCENNSLICGNENFLSQYIEVFAPDVLTFPDAILQAHVELHQSPDRQGGENESGDR